LAAWREKALLAGCLCLLDTPLQILPALLYVLRSANPFSRRDAEDAKKTRLSENQDCLPAAEAACHRFRAVRQLCAVGNDPFHGFALRCALCGLARDGSSCWVLVFGRYARSDLYLLVSTFFGVQIPSLAETQRTPRKPSSTTIKAVLLPSRRTTASGHSRVSDSASHGFALLCALCGLARDGLFRVRIRGVRGSLRELPCYQTRVRRAWAASFNIVNRSWASASV